MVDRRIGQGHICFRSKVKGQIINVTGVVLLIMLISWHSWILIPKSPTRSEFIATVALV